MSRNSGKKMSAVKSSKNFRKFALKESSRYTSPRAAENRNKDNIGKVKNIYDKTMSKISPLTNSNKDLRMKFNKGKSTGKKKEKSRSPKKSKRRSAKKKVTKTLKVGGEEAKSHLEKIRANASKLPRFDPAKVICKDFGSVKGFCVNTHQGMVRNYNEDRVSILLNAQEK